MPTAQLDFETNIAGWWREVKDDFWGCNSFPLAYYRLR